MVKKGEPAHESRKEQLESVILQNLVELQKVHTNLIEKFDRLSKQTGDLLTLFEMAARSFAQQPSNIASEKDKEFLDKIDRLLDQNKTIAKGLTMMEERMKERVYGVGMVHEETSSNEDETPVVPKPLPKF